MDTVTERLLVAAHDGVVVHLWRHVAAGALPDLPAVILCHGFTQNRFAFQCERRSLVTFLVGLGFVVYVPELRGRRGGATASGLSDYVDLDAVAIVDLVTKRHTRVSWVGHSMGGMIGTLLPDAQRDALDRVVTIGTPLIPGRPSLHRLLQPRRAQHVARFAHARGLRFEGRRFGDAFHALRGLLDEPLVPAPIRLWAPRSLEDASLTHALTRAFSDDSWAVLADLLELMASDGERAGAVHAAARLRRFDRPLLTVMGDADDLAPPSGARPLFERVGSAEKHAIEIGLPRARRAGHIDLIIGTAAPADVWAPVAAFLTGAAVGARPLSTPLDGLTDRLYEKVSGDAPDVHAPLS